MSCNGKSDYECEVIGNGTEFPYPDGPKKTVARENENLENPEEIRKGNPGTFSKRPQAIRKKQGRRLCK